MSRRARTTTAGLLAVVVLPACGGAGDDGATDPPAPERTTAEAPTTSPTPAPEATAEPVPQEPRILATGLDVPWGVDFLPDNRVLRMVYEGATLRPDVVVLEGIPRETYHSGGRIHFGPDGYLYVATGDAAVPSISQDPASLGGKILRVDEDGRPAPGNPDEGSPVWSLGHRNVQGMGWDTEGRMFAAELGQDTWDELNVIEPGGSYGWPDVEGEGGVEGYTDPLATWRPAEASPSGIAVTDTAVYVAALRGESLWRVPLDGGEPQRLLAGEYGRLRTVTVAPDGRLWLVTSNTFRGSPAADDDRIVAVGEEWLAGRSR